MSITRPATIQNAWASTASGGYINTVPQTGSGVGGAANWQLGFPPTTFGVGAIPPNGADINGGLNVISANIQWTNAGMPPVFDSVLSAAIGGYPKGAVLCLADGLTYVISVVANNTANPNSAGVGPLSGSNWFPFGGPLAGAGNTGYDFGSSANARVVAMPLPQTQNIPGTVGIIVSSYANTGAVTLNCGGGALPLLNNVGGALVANDIVVGMVYHVALHQSGSSWIILNPVTSQLNATALGLFAAQHIVTGSRVLGTTYTNSTGKPMMVMVSVTNGGAASNLAGIVAGVTGVTQGQAASGAIYSISFVVGVGLTYSATISSGGTLLTWAETY
jgi:hypothetical protein